jgi:hypothetical protein
MVQLLTLYVIDVGELQLQLIGDVVRESDRDLHGVILFRDGNLSWLPMMGVPLILNLIASIKQRRDLALLCVLCDRSLSGWWCEA